MDKPFRKRFGKFDSDVSLERRMVYFAEGAPEAAPAAQDGAETVAFNLTLSEEARKKGAQAAAVIVKVKKDEQQYRSSGAIVHDLVAQLKALGFKIPEGMSFTSLDEAIDWVLEHTDLNDKPLTLGDIHIDPDAAKRFRELEIEFVFDQASQHLDFKIPAHVDILDLDGNKVPVLPITDMTKVVDVNISFDEDSKSFLVIVGNEDDSVFRRTLKYHVNEDAKTA